MNSIERAIAAKLVAMASEKTAALAQAEAAVAQDSTRGGNGPSETDWRAARRLRHQLAAIDEIAGMLLEESNHA